eukprot:gene15413-biopygen2161
MERPAVLAISAARLGQSEPRSCINRIIRDALNSLSSDASKERCSASGDAFLSGMACPYFRNFATRVTQKHDFLGVPGRARAPGGPTKQGPCLAQPRQVRTLESNEVASFPGACGALHFGEGPPHLPGVS